MWVKEAVGRCRGRDENYETLVPNFYLVLKSIDVSEVIPVMPNSNKYEQEYSDG